MSTEKKNVLLVGLGAVGTVYAYVLKSAGKATVTCIARENYDATLKNGIFIRSKRYGDIPNWKPDRLFKSVADAAESGDSYSHVIVATKALPEIAPTFSILEPLLHKANKLPIFILLQNGIGIERNFYNDVVQLRNEKPTIITAAVWIGSNVLEGNIVDHSFPERLVIGAYRPSFSPDVVNSPEEKAVLEGFKSLFEGSVSPVTIVDEIQREKFEKNFWNASFGTCAALSRHALMSFFRDETVEKQAIPQIRGMMQEMLAIGRAMGFSEEILPSSEIEVLISRTGQIHKEEGFSHTPSILLDLESGRPMELEVLLGELVRRAKELGVDAPRLETVYSLLFVVQRQLCKL